MVVPPALLLFSSFIGDSCMQLDSNSFMYGCGCWKWTWSSWTGSPLLGLKRKEAERAALFLSKIYNLSLPLLFTVFSLHTWSQIWWWWRKTEVTENAPSCNAHDCIFSSVYPATNIKLEGTGDFKEGCLKKKQPKSSIQAQLLVIYCKN